MFVFGLSGEWKVRSLDQEDWIDAIVPGGVHLDLLNSGTIPDPFLGDNENKVQWVAEKDWEFKRTFFLEEPFLNQQKIELICDGLDTLAEVYINDQQVLSAQNMFYAQISSIKHVLHPGENEIRIIFRSPLRFVELKMKERPLAGVGDWIPGWQYLRKAACHFGGDWSPKLLNMGIWKDIRLVAWSDARIEDVFIRQHHYNGRVTIAFLVNTDILVKKDLLAEVKLTSPKGEIYSIQQLLPLGRSEVLPIFIDKPLYWWPNGYGDQPLYQVEISLSDGDVVLDLHRFQIGLRKLELRIEEDPWGTSFTFVVNDLPIFAKGSNWIPADSFPSRVNGERLEGLIQSAALANQNMIRVWGGGYYEDDAFYDLCDRYGLLVWQDFMFTGAVYPLDDESFLENLRMEVSQVVHRLRHHACLALWCGNNEMELGWKEWGWDQPGAQDLKKAYQRFFHQVLPAWVMDEDPERTYWPASPASGDPFENPQSDQHGDIHQWQVWHELKPFRQYRDCTPRFVSEFGFQSLPALKTIVNFAASCDLNINSYVMEHHQKNSAGNVKMMTYLCNDFLMPKDFPATIYLTQIQQAEALRTGVEHWRRCNERTGGTLFWQLNDCWPVASWSSIDYYGRWKAAHYFSKNFFAPLMVSVKDDGTRMEIFATNDYPHLSTGMVRWTLMTLDGEILCSDEKIFIVMPAATELLEVLNLSEQVNNGNYRNVALLVECFQEEELISTQITTFVPDKHLLLKPPEIRTNLIGSGREIYLTLTAASLARFVELSLEGADVIFSSNYFDLPANKQYLVMFTLPEGWTLDKARQMLKVYSLIDSYQS